MLGSVWNVLTVDMIDKCRQAFVFRRQLVTITVAFLYDRSESIELVIQRQSHVAGQTCCPFETIKAWRVIWLVSILLNEPFAFVSSIYCTLKEVFNFIDIANQECIDCLDAIVEHSRVYRSILARIDMYMVWSNEHFSHRHSSEDTPSHTIDALDEHPDTNFRRKTLNRLIQLNIRSQTQRTLPSVWKTNNASRKTTRRPLRTDASIVRMSIECDTDFKCFVALMWMRENTNTSRRHRKITTNESIVL